MESAACIPPPGKIVSGGQTGADRAALDWAIARSIPHGGWCPRGRRAEDGPLPARYILRETPSSNYLERTGWNVRDSDATIVFTMTAAGLTSGTLKTAEIADRMGKPILHLWPAGAHDPAERHPAARLRQFLFRHQVVTLNVAGPRASQQPGVYPLVWDTLEASLAEYATTFPGHQPAGNGKADEQTIRTSAKSIQR